MKVNVVDGEPQIVAEARSSNGQWKPLRQFIEEEVEESFSELIRGNVITATRYFHQRVKMMINKIKGSNGAVNIECPGLDYQTTDYAKIK